MDRKFTPMSQELFCEDELLCYEVRSKGTGETYFLTAYEYFYTDCEPIEFVCETPTAPQPIRAVVKPANFYRIRTAACRSSWAMNLSRFIG